MDNIKKLYDEIFTDNGDIKSCGREKCKELIALLETTYPNIDFGNKNTGFMNVKNIKEIINTILSN